MPMIALLVCLLPGCILDQVFDCEHGRGEVISESFSVGSFDGVKLRMDANVYLTQGDRTDVIITGQANILDELEFRVRGGELIIDNERCLRDYRTIEVFLATPDIRSLSISGSGAIIGENQFVVDDLDLAISGSGNMNLALDADDIEATISGSGDLYLEGLADHLDFRVSGSGDLKAFNLEVNRADIAISGSGDAEVYVLDFLDVRISGSGDVLYRGNPSIDARVSGSGKVIDAN